MGSNPMHKEVHGFASQTLWRFTGSYPNVEESYGGTRVRTSDFMIFMLGNMWVAIPLHHDP